MFGLGTDISLRHRYSCRSQQTAAERAGDRFDCGSVERGDIDSFTRRQVIAAGHSYIDLAVFTGLSADAGPGKYQTAAACHSAGL